MQERGYRKVEDRLQRKICCDRTTGNGFKLKEEDLDCIRRTRFFTVRIVRHWNRLPRDVVDAMSLETFKGSQHLT